VRIIFGMRIRVSQPCRVVKMHRHDDLDVEMIASRLRMMGTGTGILLVPI
jgi:hypothetical protein